MWCFSFGSQTSQQTCTRCGGTQAFHMLVVVWLHSDLLTCSRDIGTMGRNWWLLMKPCCCASVLVSIVWLKWKILSKIEDPAQGCYLFRFDCNVFAELLDSSSFSCERGMVLPAAQSGGPWCIVQWPHPESKKQILQGRSATGYGLGTSICNFQGWDRDTCTRILNGSAYSMQWFFLLYTILMVVNDPKNQMFLDQWNTGSENYCQWQCLFQTHQKTIKDFRRPLRHLKKFLKVLWIHFKLIQVSWALQLCATIVH